MSLRSTLQGTSGPHGTDGSGECDGFSPISELLTT